MYQNSFGSVHLLLFLSGEGYQCEECFTGGWTLKPGHPEDPPAPIPLQENEQTAGSTQGHSSGDVPANQVQTTLAANTVITTVGPLAFPTEDNQFETSSLFWSSSTAAIPTDLLTTLSQIRTTSPPTTTTTTPTTTKPSTTTSTTSMPTTTTPTTTKPTTTTPTTTAPTTTAPTTTTTTRSTTTTTTTSTTTTTPTTTTTTFKTTTTSAPTTTLSPSTTTIQTPETTSNPLGRLPNPPAPVRELTALRLEELMLELRELFITNVSINYKYMACMCIILKF